MIVSSVILCSVCVGIHIGNLYPQYRYVYVPQYSILESIYITETESLGLRETFGDHPVQLLLLKQVP
mgnify:CR=1 FL=1